MSQSGNTAQPAHVRVSIGLPSNWMLLPVGAFVARASPPDAVPQEARMLAETALADLGHYSSSLGGRGLELVLAAFGLEPISGAVTPVGATLGVVKLTPTENDSGESSSPEGTIGERSRGDDAETDSGVVTAETISAHGGTVAVSVVRRAVHMRDVPGIVVLLTLVARSDAWNDVIEARLADIADTLSAEA